MHFKVSRRAMPAEIARHVEAARERLHMVIEHGTDAMTAGVKQAVEQWGAF